MKVFTQSTQIGLCIYISSIHVPLLGLYSPDDRLTDGIRTVCFIYEHVYIKQPVFNNFKSRRQLKKNSFQFKGTISLQSNIYTHTHTHKHFDSKSSYYRKMMTKFVQVFK